MVSSSQRKNLKFTLKKPHIPMHINILSLFPDFFTSPLSTALLHKATKAGLLSFTLCNPRDFTHDPHHTVDDRPYGGSPGMLMMLEPLVQSLRNLENTQEDGQEDSQKASTKQNKIGRLIVLSPFGKSLTQELAKELAQEETLTLICGRYEGIDARLDEIFELEHICVGEAVINGGESAALMLIEATSRLIPGFMGKESSGEEESFSQGLLEHPHYTRPEVFEGQAVPPVLLSGHHKAISTWRKEKSLERTLAARPDLLDTAPLNSADLDYLHTFLQSEEARTAKKNHHLASLGRNLHTALVHYPVLLGNGTAGATSVTNLDMHDMARCACTYGLSSCTIVTPLEDQSRLVKSLIDHWTKGPGAKSNPDRAKALSLLHHQPDIKSTIDHITKQSGERPFIVVTSAKSPQSEKSLLSPLALREILWHKTVLVLFGTGQGLADTVLKEADACMRPLRFLSHYNHMSVRSAYAVILDRILGDLY